MTDLAYPAHPLGTLYDELEGWDPHNELALPALAPRVPKKPRRGRS